VPVHGYRRWTNRPVAREPDHGARRRLWAFVVGIVVTCSPLALWQLEQNECLRLTYEAGRLRAEQERLSEVARRLRARREALRSLVEVEEWALSNGWVRPQPEQLVVVAEVPPPAAELVAANAGPRVRGE
jgi:hypothetical protein